MSAHRCGLIQCVECFPGWADEYNAATRDRTEHLRALADHEPTYYLRGTDRRVEDVPWELKGVFEE